MFVGCRLIVYLAGEPLLERDLRGAAPAGISRDLGVTRGTEDFLSLTPPPTPAPFTPSKVPLDMTTVVVVMVPGGAIVSDAAAGDGEALVVEVEPWVVVVVVATAVVP